MEHVTVRVIEKGRAGTHLHHGARRVGQFGVERVEDDAVVQDPAKVGQEGPRRGVAAVLDALLQLRHVQRVHHVLVVARKLRHLPAPNVEKKQEKQSQSTLWGSRPPSLPHGRAPPKKKKTRSALLPLGQSGHRTLWGS